MIFPNDFKKIIFKLKKMAVTTLLSKLTKQQISEIQRDLVLIPITKNDFMKKKYSSVQPDPILLYEPMDDYIRLPFNYGCCLMGEIFNTNKPTYSFNFTANLSEKQVSYIKESMEYLNTYNTTTLGAPTGEGKSRMSTYIASKLSKMICILIPIQLLITSWLTTISECLNYDDVWVVGNNDKILKKGIPKIIICMKDRACNIPEEIRTQIGTLIVDEAHKFCTKDGAKSLLTFEPEYTIMLTATLERKYDQQHRIIQRIAGEHGVFIKASKPFLFIKLNTGIKVEEAYNKSGAYEGKVNCSDLYRKLAECEERNKIIVDIIKSNIIKSKFIYDNPNKFMIFTNLKDHVKILTSHFNEMNISNDCLYGNKNDYTESDVLIGICQKMGVGFDEATFCENLQHKSNIGIFAFSMKEESSVTQYIGRLRCENPIIIWLVDDHRMSNNHLRVITPLIKEIKGKIIEIDYTPGCINFDDIRTYF